MTRQKLRQQTLTGRLTIMKGSQAPPIVKGHAPSVAVDVGGAAAASEAAKAESKVRLGGGIDAH